MRVFGIQPDGQFSEYIQTPFQVDHEEAILEDWLESNPDGIVEDGRILIIGRQVVINFGGFIDLLGLDRKGDVVVVELKRDRTPISWPILTAVMF
jgi:RecB family endonuclease NucS